MVYDVAYLQAFDTCHPFKLVWQKTIANRNKTKFSFLNIFFLNWMSNSCIFVNTSLISSICITSELWAGIHTQRTSILERNAIQIKEYCPQRFGPDSTNVTIGTRTNPIGVRTIHLFENPQHGYYIFENNPNSIIINTANRCWNLNEHRRFPSSFDWIMSNIFMIVLSRR